MIEVGDIIHAHDLEGPVLVFKEGWVGGEDGFWFQTSKGVQFARESEILAYRKPDQTNYPCACGAIR